LRANGSRERAPDDRLREAIQKVATPGVKLDCFVAFAPRNDARARNICGTLRGMNILSFNRGRGSFMASFITFAND
jgi:hypothetical protein